MIPSRDEDASDETTTVVVMAIEFVFFDQPDTSNVLELVVSEDDIQTLRAALEAAYRLETEPNWRPGS